MRSLQSPASIRPVSTTSRRWAACDTGGTRRGASALAALSVCALAGLGVVGHAKTEARPRAEACRSGASRMARVELYFSGVTGTGWRRFLAQVITPRFPEGLTSIDAAGQWHGPHGIQREAAHVVVVFYRPDATSEARIEAIRRLYKARFRQTSVLRADTTACVEF